MKFLKQLLLLFAVTHQISGQAHRLRFHLSPSENFACVLIQDEYLVKYRGLESNSENEIKYSVKPASSVSMESHLVTDIDNKIVEVFAKNHDSAQALMESMCKSVETIKPLQNGINADPEIRKIVDGGDQRNRIDVVFMGDGYTASEKEKFFSDMERLTEDMFEGVTFRSYLPVFNIWAIYVESQDSGIGYSGAKNTPFRLYREGGQLRAIYTGNAGYARQVCALTGTSGCDYPSLIGNDDFYGGLGGEFVISTKSNRTGTTVLRHEMGHNMVDVGEEYDNGYVYSGVNAARSVATLGWSAWLTGERREERATFRIIQHPWLDLSDGPRSFSFNSDGAYSRWKLSISVSAAGEEDSLEITLDGQVLPWQSRGYDDREFYNWWGNQGFSSGQHTVTVRSKTASTHPDIPRMLCHITLHEWGSEDEFHADDSHVSAYPTWSAFGAKSFRPANELCLMRNMTSDRFCPVCQEGMWSEFLQRVSLIDNVTVSDSSQDGTRQVTVETLKLGQLRAPGNEVPGEALEVKWFKGTVEQVELRDQFVINAEAGSWTVEVHFNTSEVRHDPRNLLTSTETFVVPAIL